ncbi:MAG TPA: hypothetical protein VL295_01770 [Gemmatimonadales bacterium]|nr:hypothetical protein [Gemmatimonadales bacterium]
MQRDPLRSLVLALLALVLSAAPARAQLTANMGNGWTLTFSGNINAHMIYLKSDDGGDLGANPSGLVPAGPEGFEIRTGMVPAMATFAIKGNDDGRPLGATITFAPQIQCGGGSSNCSGPQIDTRQAFVTIGGVKGGTLLVGRDLGLFGRQNLLNDMTMWGTGFVDFQGTGTTLGRFGMGYNYPNYNPQFTWMNSGNGGSQFSIGLFAPDATAGGLAKLPRLEAEWTKTSGNTGFWISGLWQTQDAGGTSLNSTAAAGGLKWAKGKESLVGAGFFGSGIGTTVNFAGDAFSGTDGRTTWGAYGQWMHTMNARTTLGLSVGQNVLNGVNAEPDVIVTNRSFIAGLYNKYGRHLRSDLELTYATSEDDASGNNSQWNLSGGIMLIW